MRSCILSLGSILPVSAKRPRPWAKTVSWGRAASQMASRRAVRWSTVLPRPSAATVPSSMRRSYRARSGSGPPSGCRSLGLAVVPCLLSVLRMIPTACSEDARSSAEWCADRDGVFGCSVSCLKVWVSAVSFFPRIELAAVSLFLGNVVAGRLGDLGDRVGSGQAEFFGPALDVGPEPVSFVQVIVGDGVGQDHRGDGGVAVQG